MADTTPTTLPIIKWVGFYSQRARDLKAWRERRRVNFAMHWEREDGKVTQQQWRQAARDAGLFYVDTYLSDDDANDPFLIGWILTNSDEWNRVRGNPPVRPAVAPFVAQAQQLAALNGSAGTNKIILANADGMAVTTAMFENPPYNGVNNNEKALLPYLTGRSMDLYPVVQTASTDPAQVARRPMDMPAKALWRMRTWCESWGAPPALYCGIIEAAKDARKPLGVTGAQMREQVEYLMGLRSFAVPNNRGKAVPFQGQLADMVVWWTANGMDGPGWNWAAFNDEQEAALIQITRELLNDPAPAPVPVPVPDPTPVPVPMPTPDPVPTPIPAPTLSELVAAIVGPQLGTLRDDLARTTAKADAAQQKADAAQAAIDRMIQAATQPAVKP